MNLCRECNQDFGSVEAFDAHRVGKHTFTYWEGMRMDPPREDGRRCLSIEEMEERGFIRAGKAARWSISVRAGSTYRERRKARVGARAHAREASPQ